MNSPIDTNLSTDPNRSTFDGTPLPEPLLTVAEAARLIGTTENALRLRMRSRQVPYLKLKDKRVLRFRPADLRAWMAQGGHPAACG